MEDDSARDLTPEILTPNVDDIPSYDSVDCRLDRSDSDLEKLIQHNIAVTGASSTADEMICLSEPNLSDWDEQVNCNSCDLTLRVHDMELVSTLQVLCEGKPPVTGGFPSQRASNAELCFLFLSTRTIFVTNSQVASDLRCHITHVRSL